MLPERRQPWLELTLHSQADAADAIVEQLERLGAQGVAVEDPDDLRRIVADPNETVFVDPDILEELGEDVLVRAWFYLEGDEEAEAARREAQVRQMLDEVAQFLPVGPAEIASRVVDEAEWAETWKQYYQPLRLSPRILVCPTWIEVEPEEGVECIRLDPGAAFGTGSHETTALCVAGIDDYMAPRSTVLDVGTGSGILSIVAARLGARAVDACDIDPHAVRVAEANIRANGVAEQVQLWVGGAAETERQYDLVVANLLADILIDDAALLAARLAPLGLLLASGLIAERREEVVAAFAAEGLKLHGKLEQNDWQLLIFSHED